MDAVIENWCQAASQETDSELFSDAEIIRSIPGVGRKVSSVLLSQAPEAIERRDHQALRALSSVAPVTQRSGQKTVVRQQRAVNQLMQNALYHFARVACQRDAIYKRKLYDLKARGKTQGQALRCVGDRMLKALCTMLENNALYEPVQLETDADA